jgi:hypothetical protein
MVEFDVNDQVEMDRFLGMIPSHVRSYDYNDKNIPYIDINEWAYVEFPNFRIRFVSMRKNG